jgi:hypothetical protein
MMTRVTAILVVAGLLGCASDRTTRWESRQQTADDTPFGGGFPKSNRPDGDPFGHAGIVTQVRPHYGADNGAPETRVGNNGDAHVGNGDGRIDRRTQ